MAYRISRTVKLIRVVRTKINLLTYIRMHVPKGILAWLGLEREEAPEEDGLTIMVKRAILAAQVGDVGLGHGGWAFGVCGAAG